MKFYLLLLLFTCSPALAGSNHFHPVKVAKCASKKCTAAEIDPSISKGILELLKWGKIEKKWEGATTETIDHKTFTKKNGKSLSCWVAKISKTTSSSKPDYHFVFITESGKVFRANSTGVLK